MIRKFCKFLLMYLLVCSMSFFSYATIASADGSAFVTKSEFESTLAEFNTRLTTFEAGINTKIDSQVTSYLDRNGIWSAKEQTLVTKVLNWDTGTNASSLLTYISGFNNTDSIGNISYVFKDIDIVKSINKSGLLCADVYTAKGNQNSDGTFSISTPQGYTMAFYDIKKQGTDATWDNTGNVSIANRGTPFWRGIFYIGSVVKSTFDIGNTYTSQVPPNQQSAGNQNIERESISYIYQFKEWTQSFYFFVAKNDYLKFKIEIGYQGAFYGNTGYGPTAKRGFDSARANIVFDKIMVY